MFFLKVFSTSKILAGTYLVGALLEHVDPELVGGLHRLRRHRHVPAILFKNHSDLPIIPFWATRIHQLYDRFLLRKPSNLYTECMVLFG